MNNKALNKILEFREYPKGWRYGEGVPFKEETIINAICINTALLLYNKTAETDTSPGADGSILIAAACSDSDYWEFTAEPDGTITVVLEKNREVEMYEEGLSLSSALHIAESLYFHTKLLSPAPIGRIKEPCFSSEYSRQPIMFMSKEKNVFPAKPSKLRQGGYWEKSQVSLSLIENASSQQATPFARISDDFTAISPETPLYSGRQTQTSFLKVTA